MKKKKIHNNIPYSQRVGLTQEEKRVEFSTK